MIINDFLNLGNLYKPILSIRKLTQYGIHTLLFILLSHFPCFNLIRVFIISYLLLELFVLFAELFISLTGMNIFMNNRIGDL